MPSRQDKKHTKWAPSVKSAADGAHSYSFTKHYSLNTKRFPKVFVGLSGGVDSSVSAALLKKAGFDVHGVFIKTWTPDWLPCTWKEERLDAMRVAAHLDIPFTTLDLTKEYKKDVADYMIAEYKAGRTPNPDVMCNKHIKFGAFYDWAMNPPTGGGASYVATGHYARIAPAESLKLKVERENLKLQTYNLKLLTGVDPNKDQSYFLWTLRPDQLKHVLFPVGQFTKPEVRIMAKEFGLPTAEKKDSQGLCFMGKIDLKDFLSHYIKPRRGAVLNEDGEEVGYHDGCEFLTLGERHGFTITKKTPNDPPLFIVKKDIDKNVITVGSRICGSRTATNLRVILVKDINWISGKPDKNAKLFARLRYRQPLEDVRIMNDELGITGKTLKIEFKRPQIAAPGQSVVFYNGDECLGGGVIE